MNKVLTLLLIVFSLLLTALFTRNGDLVWMMLPFLAYLGLGILQSPSAGASRLRAVRSVDKRLDGLSSMEMSITFGNQGAAMFYLCFSDPLLPGMKMTEGRLRQSTVLRTGEEIVLKYAFQSARGSFAWKTIRAEISAPFGPIETTIELPAEAEIQVSPELNRFRPFPIRPRNTLHSAGSIPARLGGGGTDFWGVREYHVGDPLRRLDWRLTARHPRQFFTKEFEQEEIADIGLIMDARKKTDLHAGADSLFEQAARATASLAEVFLRQGNRVSLLIFREKLVKLYPGYGKVQLNRILRTLAQVVPEEDGSFDSFQFLPTHLFSSHSLIIILSPLARDDWRLFPRLRAFGYQVLLISPDPIDYARRGLPADPATQLAGRLTGLERQLEIRKITQLRIPVIDWQVSQPLSPLVRNAFTQFHIQR